MKRILLDALFYVAMAPFLLAYIVFLNLGVLLMSAACGINFLFNHFLGCNLDQPWRLRK